MRRNLLLIVGWVGLLVGLLVGSCAGQQYPDRWVYVARNLTKDEHVEDIRQIIATAASHGLNGMLWAGGADTLSRWDEQRLRRLEEVKRICEAAGIEIIPLGFSVGYGGAMLGYDPNLAEGLFVDRAVFQVRGAEAQLVPDPPVSVENGDFEQFEGNRFAGFGFHDKPGQVSFVDQEVFHSGRASLRFQDFGGPDNPDGHARVMATVTVTPRRHYAFSVWVKTEGLSPTSAFALQVYSEKRNIGAFRPALESTQDWTRIVYVFNSLDNRQLRLYAGLWGGKEGRLWIDDMAIEEVGLRCVLRRPGTPITVTSEDGQTVYEEGKDFAQIVDPKLRDFRGNHEDPPINILPGSRIKDGDRLRVSFYHAQVVQESQVTICMSEPAVYEVWRNEVRHIEQRLHPQKYFLSMDEIRQGGSCAACKARNMSMAEILGDCITKQCAIIHEVNPQAKIYIWSDMLDPNHNAHGDYYFVEGDFTGSWEHVPKDLVIVCWYYDKRRESLKFFSDLGFETLAGAYYDGDTLDNPKGWLEALAETPRARGIMYTTWRNKYDLLAGFGDLVSGR
jgi:hypothetical protein